MESYKKLGFMLVVIAVLLLASETSPALASRAQGGLPLAILGDGKALENVNPPRCSINGETCSIETDEFLCCSGCSCYVPPPPPIWPPSSDIGNCIGSCSPPPKCSRNGEICFMGSQCCSGCFCDAPSDWPSVPGICRGSCSAPPQCSSNGEICTDWSPCCSGCFCEIPPPPPPLGYCIGSCSAPE